VEVPCATLPVDFGIQEIFRHRVNYGAKMFIKLDCRLKNSAFERGKLNMFIKRLMTNIPPVEWL
jgi:hypothetical protein